MAQQMSWQGFRVLEVFIEHLSQRLSIHMAQRQHRFALHGELANDALATQRRESSNDVILQDSAVFLPLTAKQNLAVVSDTVGGFKFGFQEFDIPVAGLYVKPPAPPPSDDLSDGAIVGSAPLLPSRTAKLRRGAPP